MNDYTLVEKMLPGRVLTELGIYLQSAAHLELAIWQIIMCSDGEFNPTKERFTEYLEVKNVTRKLVSDLRATNGKLPPPIALRVSILVSKIEDGLLNRNMAAHGAFFLENGHLMVSHYWPVGKRPNRAWFEATEEISRGTIAQAIDEIDLLLREAVSIRDGLQNPGNER